MSRNIPQTSRLLDWVVIAILIAVSLSSIMLTPRGGQRTFMLYTSTETRQLPPTDAIINLQGEGVIIEVQDGRARVLKADCIDQICVRTGWVSRCGQAAVCAPNRVAVVVECEQGAVDAVSE